MFHFTVISDVIGAKGLANQWTQSTWR